MFRGFALLTFLVAAGAVSAAPPPTKPATDAASELKKLQGRWKLVEVDDGDGPIAKRGFAPVTWVIKNDQLSSEYQDGVIEENGPFKLTVEDNQKKIDFKSGEKGKDWRDRYGIYSLDGDKLKICWNAVVPADEKRRPKDFTVKAGTGNQLSVFERVKE